LKTWQFIYREPSGWGKNLSNNQWFLQSFHLSRWKWRFGINCACVCFPDVTKNRNPAGDETY
jgi:hypothetical protein